MRAVFSGLSLVLLVSGCGGGAMSLTEYVESVNVIVGNAAQQYESLLASPRGDVLGVDRSQLNAFTPQDLQAALEQTSAIETEFKEAVEELEPPDAVADLHRFLIDPELTEVEAALAHRAGSAASWDELSASAEMAAYRAVLTRDRLDCFELEAELDATADRGAFADTPWLPSEMKEIVDAALGCVGFPAQPDDVYRPLPASVP